MNISLRHRIKLTILLLLISFFLEFLSLYPFFNWKLIPFPNYDASESMLRIYYQKPDTDSWHRLSFREANYKKKLDVDWNHYLKNKDLSLLQKSLEKLIPHPFQKFKIVEEVYTPSEIIKDTNAVLRKDVLVFEK